MSFVLIAFAALAAVQADSAPPLRPCGNDEIGVAQCAVVQVQERSGSDRSVALDVMILRSTGPAEPDPLFVLQGGPGQASTLQADFYARTFAELRRSRDIYLVDVRGTGASDSLHCAVEASGGGDMLPVAAVRACRELHQPKNLASYSTRQIVADLELVRRRFGIRRLNLYGTSYGSRLGFEYIRLHPRTVRTAVLSGVLPAQSDPPADYARFGQQTFDRYAALCRTIPVCDESYPDPAGDLARAGEAVESAFAAGNSSLSPGLFGELVRMELYGPGRVPGLLRALRSAAAGDLSFWERRAERLMGVWSPQGLSLGMFLSVTCGDFMPAVDPERVRRASAGTFAGAYRFEQQAAACSAWPMPTAPRSFFTPVRSSVPTLLVSGEYDPVTPPEWGEMAARTLSRSRTVIIANNGHALGEAAGCVGSMAATLIETRKPRMIDSGCADDLPPPDFSRR